MCQVYGSFAGTNCGFSSDSAWEETVQEVDDHSYNDYGSGLGAAVSAASSINKYAQTCDRSFLWYRIDLRVLLCSAFVGSHNFQRISSEMIVYGCNVEEIRWRRHRRIIKKNYNTKVV